jgi:hypothetical protein
VLNNVKLTKAVEASRSLFLSIKMNVTNDAVATKKEAIPHEKLIKVW